MNYKDYLRKIMPSLQTRKALLDAIYGDIGRQLKQIEKRINQLDEKNEYFYYCLQRNSSENELELKKRVLASLPKASGNLRGFQSVSYYILSRLKDICDEHGLQFFLSGGTLLGAVRHHGFIPWDDDVDVYMLRSDYQKLKQVLKDDKELTLQRYYKYSALDGKAGYIIKIKLRESELFFVDIFPNDLISSQLPADELWTINKHVSNEFHIELDRLFQKHNFSRAWVLPIAFPSLDDEVELLEEKFRSRFVSQAGSSGEEFLCMGIEMEDGFRRLHKIAPDGIFVPMKENELLFETGKFHAPNDIERFLQIQFGNYWSLPKSMKPLHAEEFVNVSEKDLALMADKMLQ